MIVVRVELWPGGDEKAAREIGSAYIWNASNLAEISDYGFRLTHRKEGADREEVSEGVVIRHPRYEGVWRLIRRVIDKAGAR